MVGVRNFLHRKSLLCGKIVWVVLTTASAAGMFYEKYSLQPELILGLPNVALTDCVLLLPLTVLDCLHVGRNYNTWLETEFVVQYQNVALVH